MFAAIIKTIVLFTTLNISLWQNSYYSGLITKLTQPSFPHTTIVLNSNENSAEFTSYSAVSDPSNKYYYVLHDITSMPTWLFLIRYNNKINDELWHRGEHFNTPCNVVQGNQLLLHLKTVGFIKTDIIFKIQYEVQNTKYGVAVIVNMDKSYASDKVKEFRMILWAFPHPTIKNLVIIVSQGYLKTDVDINMIDNHIKWHIDSVLQNFGDRLMAVTK